MNEKHSQINNQRLFKLDQVLMLRKYIILYQSEKLTARFTVQIPLRFDVIFDFFNENINYCNFYKNISINQCYGFCLSKKQLRFIVNSSTEFYKILY